VEALTQATRLSTPHYQGGAAVIGRWSTPRATCFKDLALAQLHLQERWHLRISIGRSAPAGNKAASERLQQAKSSCARLNRACTCTPFGQ
jgi:hypothetical protein